MRLKTFPFAVTQIKCASGCQRCKGPQPNDCCHMQCAAGCTGPKDSDCLVSDARDVDRHIVISEVTRFLIPLQACRHFNDSGVCKENCPPPSFYDSVTFQSKPNPNKKFNFGATCVKTCPCEHLFITPCAGGAAVGHWFWCEASLEGRRIICLLHHWFYKLLGYQLSDLRHFLNRFSVFVDNYLSMEVACTLVCPKDNQEVIITHPDGNETQKCEKCEKDCPKGGSLLDMPLQRVRAAHTDVFMHLVLTMLHSEPTCFCSARPDRFLVT